MSNKRNEYGEGTVEPVIDKATGKQKVDAKGRAVWSVYVDFSANDKTGNRKQVRRRIHGSKSDANRLKNKLIKERDNGLEAIGSMTFEQYANRWLEGRKNSSDIGERSKTDIAYAVGLLIGELGGMKLQSIKKTTIKNAIENIKRTRKSEGSYSARKCHVYLKQMLNDAVEDDYLIKNPMGSLKAPKLPENDRKSLTLEELSALCARVDESIVAAAKVYEDGESPESAYTMSTISHLVAVRLACATGMRLGEVLGLVWENVLLDIGMIRVCQNLTNTNTIKTPKTQSGNRVIALDAETGRLLKSWQAMQREIIESLNIEQTGSTPVCCSNTAQFLNYKNFNRWWGKWRNENGFDGLRFHELRHTQATLLLAQGCRLQDVQAIMGHSSSSITLDYYAHSTEENRQRAAALMGALMQGRCVTFDEISQAVEVPSLAEAV